VDSTNVQGYGECKLLPIGATTGLWVLAQKHYGGTNMEIKERLRVLRQANPGWRGWPNQQIPAGTVLLLPPAARQFVAVPGAQKVIVDNGDGLYHIIDRHYRQKRGVKLTPAQIERLIPTVAAINAIFDINNELEPGWEIYVPDEAVDNACGTRLCNSPRHDTPKPDDPGNFSLRIDVNSQLYAQLGNIGASTLTAKQVGDLTMIRDLFQKKFMQLTPVKDAAGNITHMRIRGTNRELLRVLGINGTYYRVGTESYAQAMRAYAQNTGTMVMQGASLGTGGSALFGAARNTAKSGAWGAVLTIGLDVGVYVYNGQSDKIMTRDFAMRSANNATNSAIAAGAGTLASALTVATMSAAGASVVPGVGTAVGFVVGLAVGAALSYKGVTWWK